MTGTGGIRGRRLGDRGWDGYGAAWGGAVVGEIAGVGLAALGAVAAYQVNGGAGCEGDDCEAPFAFAVFVFIGAGLVGLLVGGALGCHVALGRVGGQARSLTAALVAGLGFLAVQVLFIVPAVLQGSIGSQVLAATVACTLLVPLPARALAVHLSGGPGATDEADPAPVPGADPPRRRAW